MKRVDNEERTPSEEIWAAHKQLMHTLHRLHKPAWVESGITMPQLKLLWLLYHTGGSTIGFLAERLGVSAPTVTGVVDRLERHGLAKRQTDPSDRRVVQVVITEAGRRKLEELHELREDLMRRLFNRMEPQDREALLRGLLALHRAAQEELGPDLAEEEEEIREREEVKQWSPL